MAEEIHVDDVGTQFIVTIQDSGVAVDLSSADTLQLIFRKPDGTLLTKTATLVTDGTDGKMSYTSQTGDLDEAGYWKLQGYIVIGSNSWKTSHTLFRVCPNL